MRRASLVWAVVATILGLGLGPAVLGAGRGVHASTLPIAGPVALPEVPSGTLVVLPDGTLQNYATEQGEDGRIVVGRSSADAGRTWTPRQRILALPSGGSRLSLGEALVDHAGEVHLFFLDASRIKERRIDLWYARSHDARMRWTTPRSIWEGYTGSLNSVIQLKSGRIILPFSYQTDRAWQHRGDGVRAFTYVGSFSSMVLYSDDGGDTWQRSADELTVEAPTLSTYGAIEPVVLELRDGRVWMLIRTQRGRFYESFSRDGASWSPPVPSPIVSSDSPAGLARLPDGRILLLWNESLRYPYAFGGRQVLHGAVSADEGRTWRGHREVMRDPHRNDPPPPGGDYGTAYPFPLTLADGRVIFRSGQGAKGRTTFLLTPDWLDETTQQTDFHAGIDDWSVYGTRGVDLVADPDRPGRQALSIRRADPAWPAGAVWNFPMGRRGRIEMAVMVPSGFAAIDIGLTDHYSSPFDAEDLLNNLFNLRLTATNATPGSHRLTLDWDTDAQTCRASLDGRPIATLHQSRRAEGVDYLRLRALNDGPEQNGLLIRSVAADVSAAWASSGVSSR